MAKRSTRTPAGEAKRVPVSTKIAPDLLGLLQAASGMTRRTLGAEIEQRLFESFSPTDDLRTIIREELRAELRAELRSEIRLAMAEYTVEIGEDDGDEARH